MHIFNVFNVNVNCLKVLLMFGDDDFSFPGHELVSCSELTLILSQEGLLRLCLLIHSVPVIFHQPLDVGDDRCCLVVYLNI